MHPIRRLIPTLLVLFLTGPCPAAYLGAGLSGIALEDGRTGIRIDRLVPLGPGWRAGLRPGDVLLARDARPFEPDAEKALEAFKAELAGRAVGAGMILRLSRIEVRVARAGEPDLTDVERERLRADPVAHLRALGPGAMETLRWTCDERELEVTVTLGARPGEAGAIIPATETLFDFELPAPHPVAEDIAGWLARFDLEPQTDDLRARLAALHVRGDGARLPLITAIHRDPFRTPPLMDQLASRFRFPAGGRVSDLIASQSPALAPLLASKEYLATLPSQPGAAVDHLAYIEGCLEQAVLHRQLAFQELSEEELRFVREHWTGLTERFAQAIYLYEDDDQERLARTVQLLAIGEKIDLTELLHGYECLAPLTDREYLARLATDLAADGKDVTSGQIIVDSQSDHGRIIIAGGGNSWHRETGVAVLIDLGGDDFHGNAAGSTIFEKRGARTLEFAAPVSLVVDVDGDDAYESTHDGCQGFGFLGIGVLVDLAGDDTYLARRWGQGASFMGLGALIDATGDDVYRAESLCQGCGLYGVGLMVDGDGDDRYEARLYAQGLGLPRSVGLLLDGAGDDHYYAKGERPTTYGDEGIFDAWSQGVGLGFRTQASGGVGFLIDEAGRDRYEAGNFGQGGGYYFGVGALFDRGTSSDEYIGSRYNQGFSAHQAAGYFYEQGGDDRYRTRQAVVTGLAWDECVTVFVDGAGDDLYEGTGFSHGASAHNSICLFLECDGRDRYRDPGLARAGGNDYHGGTSLSIFLDDGQDPDVYSGSHADDTCTTLDGSVHAIFVDR